MLQPSSAGSSRLHLTPTASVSSQEAHDNLCVNRGEARALAEDQGRAARNDNRQGQPREVADVSGPSLLPE